MALRKRKPTSPGRRFQTVSDFSEITKPTPEKSLLAPKPRTGGRNNYGRKTARHRGGGHKQQYRIIDFKRNKDGVPAKVAAIEYDPNRTCRIALLHYLDGEKRYILAPKDIKVGDTVQSGQGSEIRSGNAPQGRPFSSWPRRADSQPCDFRRPRCAACRSTVVGRSVRSATPSTSCSRSARPVATAGRVFARRPAVSP